MRNCSPLTLVATKKDFWRFPIRRQNPDKILSRTILPSRWDSRGITWSDKVKMVIDNFDKTSTKFAERPSFLSFPGLL
jgi:hypothetical protein